MVTVTVETFGLFRVWYNLCFVYHVARGVLKIYYRYVWYGTNGSPGMKWTPESHKFGFDRRLKSQLRSNMTISSQP